MQGNQDWNLRLPDYLLFLLDDLFVNAFCFYDYASYNFFVHVFIDKVFDQNYQSMKLAMNINEL